MIQLPEVFAQRINHLLQEDAEAFFQSYEYFAYQGLRVNTMKISAEKFTHLSPFSLSPIPWCPSGFYYEEPDRPGKHPYHAAGLYYIQEPSAMSVVEVLNPQPGEKILDLCAAPGGKSTQIAAYLQGEGLLISNEPNRARAKILSENIERCGIRNTIVTNEDPERLAERLPLFFDRVLVDAPCSGEGMFRKNEEACRDWDEKKVFTCTIMQKEILKAAAKMLKPGGELVYSTCTFSLDENEQMISGFLDDHPDFELLPIDGTEWGFSPGIPYRESNGDDPLNGDDLLTGTVRLWPHRVKGEGHFIARLRKKEGVDLRSNKVYRLETGKVDQLALKWYRQFAIEHLKMVPEGKFTLFGEQLYLLPDETPELKTLRVLRPGWHLGTIKKGRFEPGHALALGLQAADCQMTTNFSGDSPEVIKYLKGETLEGQGKKGWALVTVDGYPVGWGKQGDGQIKNHYPKGLRWL